MIILSITLNLSVIEFISSWRHGDVIDIQSDIRCTSWARHHRINLSGYLMIWLANNWLLWHALIILKVCRSISKYNWLTRVISGGSYHSETTHISCLHRFIIFFVIIHKNGIARLSMQIMMWNRWWRIHNKLVPIQVLNHTRNPFPDEFTIVVLMLVFSYWVNILQFIKTLWILGLAVKLRRGKFMSCPFGAWKLIKIYQAFC